MTAPAPYIALALQTTCFAVNGAADAAASRPRMLASITRIADQITASKRFVGTDVRLVVLPEYFLTGFPMGETAAVWAEKAALEIDGPEYQALGDVARTADVFLSGNAYERDPHFPGLYFQTSFLIEPSGKLVLRYRRLVSLFAPSPYDVWEKYLSIYGLDGVFPVADTELGRMAAIASEEILYPDIARALTLRGAEVLLHSSSEIATSISSPKNIAKQARAIENLAYVISANSAGIEGIAIPKASTDGSSKIIDYRGLVLAEAGYGESMAAYAEIDIAGLRRYRRRPGMGNILSRQPLGLWRDALEGQDIQARNSLTGADGQTLTPDRSFYAERQRQAIARLADSGII
ncbi:nitrilase-related carbon-nitrogen hydrolase [Phenylobacterium sp.]|jgi:predicted amidohydrolase|uniref:nitrilase-related carbon-nitrogen hydrolase n=1 Tax=Phenylobacterium sp. TaxID=1871053 RepID=UPI0037C7F1B6